MRKHFIIDSHFVGFVLSNNSDLLAIKSKCMLKCANGLLVSHSEYFVIALQF